ncbi:hypothetical protein C8Q80DRAFT_644634 [Daedaleopsis nitida]|nr:hypothetical protein C8Q80DRAFT_644634 [Daedaleopsis nitida]
MSTASQISADDELPKKVRIQRLPREVSNGVILVQRRNAEAGCLQVDFDASPDWSSYARLMSEYDEAMVRGWKEEIDTLLVFAGLFSAVVTAFNIEAYKLLQDDPSNTSIQLLQQISRQLANGTDDSSITQARPTFRPASQNMRINGLWFASLVCALFSALIGIMVKQWLREYMAIISPSPRHSVQLRQHRHDGLRTWHVPEIMAFLPILLEISLVLFLAGLVDFLLLLNSTVAATTTALVTAALLFYVGTTIAPLLSTQCPFKSPQAWVLVRTQRWVAQWIHNAKPSGSRESHPLQEFANWSERDNSSVERNHDELDLKAMTWVHASFVDDDIQDSLVSVISDLKPHHATSLVVSALADEMDLSASTFARLIRDRACSSALRDTGARITQRTRARMFNMLSNSWSTSRETMTHPSLVCWTSFGSSGSFAWAHATQKTKIRVCTSPS